MYVKGALLMISLTSIKSVSSSSKKTTNDCKRGRAPSAPPLNPPLVLNNLVKEPALYYNWYYIQKRE